MTLADTLSQRSGIEPAQAGEVLRLLGMFGLIDSAALARAERDARIYELRSSMTTLALAERFEMTERQIQRVVKIQLELRRVG